MSGGWPSMKARERLRENLRRSLQSAPRLPHCILLFQVTVGEWLAACSRGQQRHVFIIRTDGTNLRDLTEDNYRNDGWPRWSPDGKRIVFTSRRTGNYELWVINRDGSALQQLTKSSGGHYSPWSPDGSMIAYSIHTPKNDCVII